MHRLRCFGTAGKIGEETRSSLSHIPMPHDATAVGGVASMHELMMEARSKPADGLVQAVNETEVLRVLRTKTQIDL